MLKYDWRRAFFLGLDWLEFRNVFVSILRWSFNGFLACICRVREIELVLSNLANI
jgi:hypothetical protein